MKSFSYEIQDELGIHARPAGALVKEAGKFVSDIKVNKGDKMADAKRLFSVMSLAVKKGEEIVITAQGTDEEEAITAMQQFLKENL